MSKSFISFLGRLRQFRLPNAGECRLVATVGGVGDRKPVPGTLGSLVALPPGLLVMALLGWKVLAVLAIGLFFLGWWAIKRSRDQFAMVDAPQIVVDEVVGMWLSLLVIDPTVPIEIVMAFLLFRYFDWDKPWPISVVQRRLLTPLGVMLDDVLAGALAALFLMAFIPLVHAYFL